MKTTIYTRISTDKQSHDSQSLTHATGHESRLARKGVSSSDGEWSSFGSTPYAREELVAEMTAAAQSAAIGVAQLELLPEFLEAKRANYLAYKER